MAHYKSDIVDVNLETGNIFRSFLNRSIGFKDDDADRFGIRAFRDGVPQDLSGASCQAIFMAPNGTNIALTSYGTVSGNVAYVTLPPACYDYEGQFTLAIKIVGGGVTSTVRIVDGIVANTGATGTVSPTSAVPTYQEIIAQYDAMVAATSAANTAIAETFDATQDYPAGKNVINDGALYILPNGHTANTTWENTTKTASKIGDQVTDNKSNFDEQKTFDNNRFDKIEENVFSFEEVALEWVSGGFTPSGATQTNDARIRNNNFVVIIPGRTMKIISDSTSYKFKILYYSTNAIASFVKMDQYFTNTEQVIFNDTNANFYIRILAGYADDSVISTVSEVSSHISMVKEIPYDYAEKNYVDDRAVAWLQFADEYSENAYWNIEGDTAVLTSLEGKFIAYDPITVSEGQQYEVTARQGNTDKARIWVVTDDSLNIISMAENHKSSSVVVSTEKVTIPAGGTKLLVTSFWATYVVLKKMETAIDIAMQKMLTGKRLSLLGDSISAFAGTIPEGNDAYYTGSNSGVSNANQMWWSVLCSLTGMVPLVINGWSGSAVTQLEDTAHVDKVPMSSDARCAALDDGTNDPDIILIAGGVNDYTYAESAQSEPLAWDGKTAPTLGNSFTEAYACMIKKLQTNYPGAIIVALSTWFTMRGTDNGYTLTHTVGSHVYTQQDYNDKIRYVAEQMHIPYIDVSNIGINRNNMYPTYAQDSSTVPTHPNANGHLLMGRAISYKLIDLVGAYLT